MRVFHGSYMAVVKPLVAIGRRNLDFGKGFYITSLEAQASKWAQTIAERKGPRASAVVTQYEFDYEKATAEFRIKRFEAYNLEWLEFVVACRRGGDVWKQYDIIEGGVANDNVIDTVEDYESGRMTAEQALDQLRFKKVNHQICITNQQVIGKYLFFEQFTTLED